MPDHTIFNERPESQDRAIQQLQNMGYSYVPRAEAERKRGRLSNVLFPDVMREFLASQSYRYSGRMVPFSERSINTAIKDLDVVLEKGPTYASKTIYDSLIFGKSCEEKLFDGGLQSFDINYIDWEHPEKNIWQVTDEFSVQRQNGKFARPDIVLLINGIPLVVIECKKSGVDVEEGVKQNIRNWQPDYIPQLFKFVQLVVAMNPNEVKYATDHTPQEYFCHWHESGKDNRKWQEDCAKRYAPNMPIIEQDKYIVSMLNKERLLDLIRFYILYDSNIKKIARYQQYFGVENTMRRIKGGDGKGCRGGVIWHTQGSGKSLTMVMLVKRITADDTIKGSRFVLVCDRLNLIKQLKDNFIHTGMEPSNANTGTALINLLKTNGVRIITTTINKFMSAAKSRTKIADENIFLLIDESHRSQGGELHNMMNEVLPNAVKIGFTGTPLLKKDKKNTYKKFGPLIGEAYKFEDGIRDKVIVPLVYEGRIVPQKEPKDKIDDYLKYILEPLNEEQREDMRRKWSRFRPIAQTSARISMLAFDINEHYLSYCCPHGYKAMVAASSRAEAIDLAHAINALGGAKAAALICSENERDGENKPLSSSEKDKIRNFFKTEVEPKFGQDDDKYEEYIKDNINGGEDVDIVVVCTMLLTGFDAPPLAVLYVDKQLKEHTLLQAIARVNRIYPGKNFGLIVDYWGLFANLNTAMDMYGDDESGLSGYDAADLADSIFTANEEKEKLIESNKKLLQFFESANFDQSNSNAWQAFFEDDDEEIATEKRKTFYGLLAGFSKHMELAISSFSLYKLVGLEHMQKYKQDLLFFQKLRMTLMKIYAEKVDFSKYEDGIRNLLNSFVTAEPVEVVVEPIAINDKAGMDKQLEEIDGQKAKAAYIKTRLVSELEARRYEDPLLYKRFSERIKETLEKYRQARDDISYFAQIKKLAEDFREGFVGNTYPSCIDDDSDAKAFYGVISDALLHGANPKGEKIEERIGQLAANINTAIKELAHVDWRGNTVIHKRMNQAVEDLLWDYADEQGIEIHVQELDLLLENVMRTAIVRY